MRKLCLGGSFNPIHHGHLLCGMAAVEKLGFDTLVLIPSAVPPLKSSTADMARATDRFGMCQLATEGVASIETNGIELQRDTPSFTIDTVRSLKSAGWGKVSWLIGTDVLATLPHWHNLPALLLEVDFVVMCRPGWTTDWQTLPAELRHLQRSVVTVPQIQISATEIRRRVRAGLSIDYMTPPAVAAFIQERGLYREENPQ